MKYNIWRKLRCLIGEHYWTGDGYEDSKDKESGKDDTSPRFDKIKAIILEGDPTIDSIYVNKYTQIYCKHCPAINPYCADQTQYNRYE